MSFNFLDKYRKFKDNHPTIIKISKIIIIGLVGFVLGLILSDKGLYFLHFSHPHNIGGWQITTYKYIDFEDLTTNYPINKSLNDQRLIVKNKWIDEVWTTTKIHFDTENNGLKIDCVALDKNSKEEYPCSKYKINSKDSKILKLTINTRDNKRSKYRNICFKTFEIGHEKNYYEDCVDFEIDIYSNIR